MTAIVAPKNSDFPAPLAPDLPSRNRPFNTVQIAALRPNLKMLKRNLAQPWRSLGAIRAELPALQREVEGLMANHRAGGC